MSDKNQKFDRCFTGGTVMTPAGAVETTVGVKDGTITALGDIDISMAAEVIDCTGLHIFPGVIDSQVHFREPGLTHKEDLESGMRSAIAGGVTTIFEMPNTNPLTLTADTLQHKLDRAAESAHANYAFFIGGSETNIENLPHLEALPGCCGVKVFMGASTGDLLTEKDVILEKIFKSGRKRVAVHAEDQERLRARAAEYTDNSDVTLHPVIRDPQAALLATQRIINIARRTGRPTHILHITTAAELDLIAKNKDIISAEATPQHLTLTAPECYERLGSRAQMNPPVRDQYHQEALWRAIENGVIDVMGSDHAPHTLDEKSQSYPNSPSGMPGVQTLVPVMLHHVNQGRLSLMRALDLMCHGPQRLFGIAGKGRLCVGYDADLTIVDMKANTEITDNWIESKCGWTPFEGLKVSAWPRMTVVNGTIVMREGEVQKHKAGQQVAFLP
ncbi:MAG: dihydroorotase [Pseudomonadota bacterium]